jgi:hypothetical protein
MVREREGNRRQDGIKRRGKIDLVLGVDKSRVRFERQGQFELVLGNNRSRVGCEDDSDHQGQFDLVLGDDKSQVKCVAYSVNIEDKSNTVTWIRIFRWMHNTSV